MGIGHDSKSQGGGMGMIIPSAEAWPGRARETKNRHTKLIRVIFGLFMAVSSYIVIT